MPYLSVSELFDRALHPVASFAGIKLQLLGFSVFHNIFKLI